MALTFAYSGTTVSVYTNGALCASGTIGEATDNGYNLAIGGSIDGTATAFEGYYDEIRPPYPTKVGMTRRRGFC